MRRKLPEPRDGHYGRVGMQYLTISRSVPCVVCSVPLTKAAPGGPALSS